jgi:hypothetical protein
MENSIQAQNVSFFKIVSSLPCSVRILSMPRIRKKHSAEDSAFHHIVYVILLDSAVAKHSSILKLNPNRDPSKPCVYVGMTGLPVDHR